MIIEVLRDSLKYFNCFKIYLFIYFIYLFINQSISKNTVWFWKFSIYNYDCLITIIHIV